MSYSPDFSPPVQDPLTGLGLVTAIHEEESARFTVAFPFPERPSNRIISLGFPMDAVEAEQQSRLVKGAEVTVTLWPADTGKANPHPTAYIDGMPILKRDDARLDFVHPLPLTQGKIGAVLAWTRVYRWESNGHRGW